MVLKLNLKIIRLTIMNNTVKRGISGTIFLLIMVSALLVNKYFYAALMLLIMVGMMFEFYGMTMGDDFRKSRFLAILSGMTLFITLFMMSAYGFSVRILALTIFPILWLMATSLQLKEKEKFWKFSHMYAGFLYIAIPLSCSNMLVFRNHVFDGLPMLCFFMIIWLSDVGAFIFGMLLGQKYGRKLCPSISPKKSWIGFWGGMFCAILTAVVLKWLGWMEYPVIHCIILASIMHVAGVIGDLFESQWKRTYNIKDSGNIIPGHGGLLDRFDSALMAIPAGVLYLMLINVL